MQHKVGIPWVQPRGMRLLRIDWCVVQSWYTFFGTAWYDLTWYIVACNLGVPLESNTTLASIGPLTDIQCTKSILAHLEPKPFAMAQFKLVPSKKTSMLGA